MRTNHTVNDGVFAKLLETDKYGQILVLLEANDEGRPCVFFKVQPPDLGVSGFNMVFPDSDEGWNQAEDCFENKMNVDECLRLAESIFTLSDIPAENEANERAIMDEYNADRLGYLND